jgi:2-dehydro-3-deoxyphosphogluconate aldolase/(4S)-4-hydroxy-2-oxoglutarate aldolase
MLRALHGPFPEIRFCPTGGINQSNAAEYLAQVNVAIVGGIWMTPADKLQAGDWAGITALARQASALSQPS